jgi:hypothetical protein
MTTAVKKAAAPRKKAAPRVVVKPAAPTTLEEAIALHKAEIEKIGKALNAAAKKEGLCEKYYTTVENLNKELSVPLPENPRVTVVTLSVILEVDDKIYPTTSGSWGSRSMSAALRDKLTKAVEAQVANIDGVLKGRNGYINDVDSERST